MKIAWYSNSPAAAVTGYGAQSAMLLPRLQQDGHEIVVLANWGQQVTIGDWNGITIMPQGLEPYSTDVIDHQVNMINPDLVITLYDVWVLAGRDLWRGRDIASWTPVDHYPVPPKVTDWCRNVRTIAMSKFGHKAFADIGISSVYIPHGIESIFQPMPSDVRRRLHVPEDAFLIMINAANIGNAPIPRKAWDINIQAAANIARANENVYLYLHTDVRRPGGVPIDGLLRFWGFPEERVRIPDQTIYRMGAVDQEELARLYTAADVLLAVSHGEGFGVPVAEAMRCGTPAIVSDFTAQPEIVGETGWKVSGQLFYDQGQHSAWIMPFVHSATKALNDAYQQWRISKPSWAERGEAARAHAAQYDADYVYGKHWQPWLSSIERERQQASRRPDPSTTIRQSKRMSGKAKRR